MSFTNQTTHYGLPQWIGSDKPTYLVDQNNAYQTIDSEIYNANVAAGDAVTTANGAASTAASAAASAAIAVETANSATTTAQTADSKADNATTLAQAAQTAAGAAQTAAEAAQTAAAGNSITNLANAYDPTLTYAVGDLVTQDGKLYQCITQVLTPEAFDINKWDDKTTSEVYLKVNNMYRYVSFNAVTATSDGTLSNSAFLSAKIPELFNTIKNGLNDGEIAVIHSISILHQTSPLAVFDEVSKTGNIPTYIHASSISHAYNATGLDLISIVYDNGNVGISTAQILNDNSVTYNDPGSDTNSTDLTMYYMVYSTN